METVELVRPSEALVQAYRDRFETVFGSSESAIRLLCERFPNNQSFEDVLLKSIVINTLYATQIRAIVPVATHIVSLKIDDRLNRGAPEVVDEVALVTIKGKTRRNYSFATKYCSFHNPSAYPIYDGFVNKLLNQYQRRDRFSSLPLGDLKEYIRFKQVLNDFAEFYGLSHVDAKELDVFLWGYGREVFG